MDDPFKPPKDLDSFPLTEHRQPCGCSYSTRKAWVVDIRWCELHTTEWRASLEKRMEELDQELEDAIFGVGAESGPH